MGNIDYHLYAVVVNEINANTIVENTLYRRAYFPQLPIEDKQFLFSQTGCLRLFAPFVDTVGACDGEIRVWDLARRNCVWRTVGHRGFVRGLSVTPDGRSFLSAGDDGMVKQWDLSVAEDLSQVCLGIESTMHADSKSDRYRLTATTVDHYLCGTHVHCTARQILP